MRTTILSDNQDITRAGLQFICKQVEGSIRFQEAKNRETLLRLLAASPNAVVILDYTLFDFTGPEDLVILQERYPLSDWLLFSEQLSEEFIRRVLYSSETTSIVMKSSSLEEIRTAVQYVLQSERFICQQITSLLLSKRPTAEQSSVEALTATEKDILKLIALGKTTKEIAAERFSSIHTIATHRKNIFRKLNVNNVHEATKYALRAGIIDEAEYYI
ncbi:response regulator transcription factor [Parabacteroides sp. Marseille-P3160]|uniref:response regulator transcription factor n=1 Tax=Parabacteroides sp. Marseille-P3160 TaxID=1917887 RepID=UPI0009BA52B6|nr:response regulator transcription factor [Parabacteroides sp. Marseille-P3160]